MYCIKCGSKFNNMSQCRDRIVKFYEAITKLGKTMAVEITVKYLNLKLDELALAHEYATQKQIEKASPRAIILILVLNFTFYFEESPILGF